MFPPAIIAVLIVVVILVLLTDFGLFALPFFFVLGDIFVALVFFNDNLGDDLVAILEDFLDDKLELAEALLDFLLFPFGDFILFFPLELKTKGLTFNAGLGTP